MIKKGPTNSWRGASPSQVPQLTVLWVGRTKCLKQGNWGSEVNCGKNIHRKWIKVHIIGIVNTWSRTFSVTKISKVHWVRLWSWFCPFLQFATAFFNWISLRFTFHICSSPFLRFATSLPPICHCGLVESSEGLKSNREENEPLTLAGFSSPLHFAFKGLWESTTSFLCCCRHIGVCQWTKSVFTSEPSILTWDGSPFIFFFVHRKLPIHEIFWHAMSHSLSVNTSGCEAAFDQWCISRTAFQRWRVKLTMKWQLW